MIWSSFNVELKIEILPFINVLSTSTELVWHTHPKNESVKGDLKF